MQDYVAPTAIPLVESHVRQALDFLISIEPIPAPETREEYEAAIQPHLHKVTEAIATMRRYAEQRSPQLLTEMQAQYYAFTNDPRYLKSAEISAVVTDALNRAWHGIGSWRR